MLNEKNKNILDLDVTFDLYFSEMEVVGNSSYRDKAMIFELFQQFVKDHNLFKKNQWGILTLVRSLDCKSITVKFFVRCSSYYFYRQISDGFNEMVILHCDNYKLYKSKVGVVGLEITDR